MIALAMVFALVMAAVLEAVLPTWTDLGRAHVPLLLGVALYYALYYPIEYLLVAAILGGLLQDSLGLVPLGYSAFCYTVVALVVANFRGVVFVQKQLSHVLVGAFGSGGSVLLMYFLLRASKLLETRLPWIFLRMMGMAVLGALAIPLVFALMLALDHMLGNSPERET